MEKTTLRPIDKRIRLFLSLMSDGMAYTPQLLHKITDIDRTQISQTIREMKRQGLVHVIGVNGPVHYYSIDKTLRLRPETIAKLPPQNTGTIPKPMPLMSALFAHKSTFNASIRSDYAY